MTCPHDHILTDTHFTRLTDMEGGPVTGYQVEIALSCGDCGVGFTWLGVPAGFHFREPRVSVDGLSLRAPMVPASERRSPLDEVVDVIAADRGLDA